MVHKRKKISLSATNKLFDLSKNWKMLNRKPRDWKKMLENHSYRKLHRKDAQNSIVGREIVQSAKGFVCNKKDLNLYHRICKKKMTLKLRVLFANAEDLGFLPITHIVFFIIVCKPSSTGCNFIYWSLWTPDAHATHKVIQTYVNACTHIYQ